MYDVAIIGAGVIGGMTARELTRFNIKVCLLEKESDVALGASKANSGIIHGGYDPLPGTLKAKLNAEGVPLIYEAARELNVPYKNNGSMIVAFGKEEEPAIDMLYERGIKNGIKDMKIISGEEARKLEPQLSEKVSKVLLVPTAGIVCPYALTEASIGNAMDNGAELLREFCVCSIDKKDVFTVTAKDGRQIKAKYVVNCAGCFSDKISGMAGDKSFDITPKSGEYMLLDKNEGGTVSHTIFGVPTKDGKGILVTPTADGNLLLGPTSTEIEEPDNTKTTNAGLSYVEKYALKSVPGINLRGVITSFCGVRASEKNGDFIIKESEKVKGFVNVAAIDSPGLTCCVAISKYVVDILKNAGMPTEENKNFNGKREDTHIIRKMSDSEKDEYIKKNPEYGRIICRCENVSEGEILDALRRNPKAVDIDGIKRRTRSGMGRCQGGFCVPYVMKLIARENNMDLNDVTKKGGNSKMTVGKL